MSPQEYDARFAAALEAGRLAEAMELTLRRLRELDYAYCAYKRHWAGAANPQQLVIGQ